VADRPPRRAERTRVGITTRHRHIKHRTNRRHRRRHRFRFNGRRHRKRRFNRRRRHRRHRFNRHRRHRFRFNRHRHRFYRRGGFRGSGFARRGCRGGCWFSRGSSARPGRFARRRRFFGRRSFSGRSRFGWGRGWSRAFFVSPPPPPPVPGGADLAEALTVAGRTADAVVAAAASRRGTRRVPAGGVRVTGAPRAPVGGGGRCERDQGESGCQDGDLPYDRRLYELHLRLPLGSQAEQLLQAGVRPVARLDLTATASAASRASVLLFASTVSLLHRRNRRADHTWSAQHRAPIREFFTKRHTWFSVKLTESAQL